MSLRLFLSSFAFLGALSGMPLLPQSQSSSTVTAQSVVLRGKGHSYSLTAPAGWVLDTDVWAKAGISAVFYPRGSSATGKQVAFTQFFLSHPTGAQGRANEDIAAYLKQQGQRTSNSYTPMKTRLGMSAIIRSVHGDIHGTSDWLAYIQAPTGVIFITMVAKDPKDFEGLREAFNELVLSCVWTAKSIPLKSSNGK